MDIEFKDKYLKYKKKYLDLKNLIAGDYTTGYGCLTCRDKEAVIEGLFTARGGILNPELFLKIANENPPGEDEINKVKRIDQMIENNSYDYKRYREYFYGLKSDVKDIDSQIEEENNKTLKTGSKKRQLEQRKEKLMNLLKDHDPGYHVVSEAMMLLGDLRDKLSAINLYKFKAINLYKEYKFIEKTEDGKIKIKSMLFAKWASEAFRRLVQNMRVYYKDRSELIDLTTPADPKKPIKFYNKEQDGQYNELSTITVPLFEIPSYILSSDEFKRLQEKKEGEGSLTYALNKLEDDLEKFNNSLFDIKLELQGDPDDIIIG
jgi:hypothetical protein